MLNKIFKLLPFFVVEWLAVRYCERIGSIGFLWYTAFDGFLVRGARLKRREMDVPQEIEVATYKCGHTVRFMDSEADWYCGLCSSTYGIVRMRKEPRSASEDEKE